MGHALCLFNDDFHIRITYFRGGVLSQALKPAAAPPHQPVRSAPPPREWQAALEHDRAAAADNAEDFTRYKPTKNLFEKVNI